MTQIGNISDFENKYNEITLEAEGVLKFVSRNPGTWGNQIEVAIANPADFGTNKQAFPGIDLDSMFEYIADEDDKEIGVIVKIGGSIKEVYLVSLDKEVKDLNGKSKFIESVINRQSTFLYVKYTGDADEGVASCLDAAVLKLAEGVSAPVTEGDITTSYEVWENKEEIDIDIVIGNEVDDGNAAFALADARKDCIAFLGVAYDIVGLKSAQANAKVAELRGDRNSMFSCFTGNYKYQYDRYADKNRWINIAGDIAGLRAQTSNSRASWWASAGLDRGQIKNIIKLAYNPNMQQRDQLYKSGVNPVVTFPGQGTVMWGQKTMLSKPSSSIKAA